MKCSTCSAEITRIDCEISCNKCVEIHNFAVKTYGENLAQLTAENKLLHAACDVHELTVTSQRETIAKLLAEIERLTEALEVWREM